MNSKWTSIDNLGPLQYYLYVKDDTELLKDAVICPPLSNDPLLKKVRDDWLILDQFERKNYIFGSDDIIISKSLDNDRPEETLYEYCPTLCVCENGDDKFYVFIKKLTWIETLSEGCGGSTGDEKIYISRSIEDLIKYSISINETNIFENFHEQSN